MLDAYCLCVGDKRNDVLQSIPDFLGHNIRISFDEFISSLFNRIEFHPHATNSKVHQGERRRIERWSGTSENVGWTARTSLFNVSFRGCLTPIFINKREGQFSWFIFVQPAPVFWLLRDDNRPHRSVSSEGPICSMLGLCRTHVGAHVGSCWAYVGYVAPMLGLYWRWGMWSHVGLCWAKLGPCWAYVGPCWAQTWQLGRF